MGVEAQRRLRSAAVALMVMSFGGLCLSGCAKSAEASSLSTPAVVWEKGEPTGPEWDSEWATAYRDAEIQLSAARAYGDFSDPDLIAALGYDQAEVRAASAKDERFDSRSDEYKFSEVHGTYAFWGSILKVVVASDGKSATIYTCAPAIEGGVKLIPVPDTALVTLTADGSYTVGAGDGSRHPGNCSDATVWVAKWATPIDIDNVGRDSVKMPLPRDYYVKLGVISE